MTTWVKFGCKFLGLVDHYWMQFNIILFFIAGLFILVMAIISRLYLLEKHFTHIDDIGVAWTILHLKDELSSIDSQCEESLIKSYTSCRYFLAKKQSEELTLPRSELGNILQQYGLLEKARTIFFLYRSFNIVPLSWTYAPAQFYLTDFLLHPGMSYGQIKFWGRFPSLLFGVIAILFLMYSVKYFESSGNVGLSVCLVSLVMSTSLQSIIYAAQMESYSIGIFSVSALTVLLGYFLNKKEISIKTALAAGAAVASLSMCQYQTLLFIPGFLLSFIVFRSPNVKIIYPLIWGAGSFLFIAVPFVFSIILSRTNRSVGWNSGPNGEFVIQSHDPVFLKLFEVISNLPLVLESMLSPVPESSLYAQLFKWLLFFLFALGVTASFINKEKRSFLLFSIVTFVTWLIFVIFGKLPFSPTRHSMVLIPLFAMFVAFGFSAVFRRLKVYSLIKYIPIFIISFWLYAFATGYKILIHERMDRFDEEILDQTFKSFSVDIVVGELTNSPYFMQSLNKSPIVFDQISNINDFHINSPFQTLRIKPNLLVAVYGRNQLSDIALYKLYEDIAKKLQLPKPQKITIVKKDEVQSKIEVDWSSRTSNGTNSFFLYIFKIDN